MNFSVGFRTDIGRKRQQNQDSGLAVPDLGLFVVADGMGGHRGGETASSMAVDIIATRVRALQTDARNLKPTEVIAESIAAANRSIFERSADDPDLNGMGTTTTALYFSDGILHIGHVGDSRCYYLRPQALWQLTRDHSLVQEKLRAGIITREQIKTDRMKNVITRSVGFEHDLAVEVYEMPVQVGDAFLICSDGLSGLIDDEELLKITQENLFDGKDLQKTVDLLVDQANENGGEDNITAILIQVV